MTTTETPSAVGFPVVSVPRMVDPPTGPYLRVGKRLFDITVATALLFVLTPFVLLVSVLSFYLLGSPVFYRQQRVGRFGRTFVMLKFRSMLPCRRLGSEQIDHADRRGTHKSLSDPRHTTFGRLMRRSSVDELPQLINVLRGDMSLVGPRPELPQIAESHGLMNHVRHSVRPGLTGLWQISEDRPGFVHENVRYDVLYTQTVSFRTDLMILIRTIPVLLRCGGQ